jgi:hypothetical protein
MSTTENTIVGERLIPELADGNNVAMNPFTPNGGFDFQDEDTPVTDQKEGHRLTSADTSATNPDEVTFDSGSNQNVGQIFRRIGAASGLTAMTAACVAGLPSPAEAQRSIFGPPQIRTNQVKGIVRLMAISDCRTRVKDTIKANPGVDIRSGKCTVPIAFIKNCHVGPLGPDQADPPILRSEGFCTSAYAMHVSDASTPNLPGLGGDIDAICSSYRLGVRLVPYFPRGRDGRIQIKWRPDPDPRPGKTVKFKCIKVPS